ncbi:EamA family transporter [Cohnella terricola]|uniref:EamA family transporter n=1 Tax=Cohnella terricola TaxID=1289167 RepID=A0A559JPY2_9BACL|nr:EamA family transporter [Cohnella terricola]TVY01945.1 EamA family transporter [Cohnella terricola]
MKYRVTVFLGAVCYGILSTIVKKAYGQGYTLGEVVGSQMLTGFVLAWALVYFIKWRAGRKGYKAAVYKQPTWKHRVILMLAGMPTAITGLLYYQSLKYIPNSLAILLLFQFTWIGVLIHAIGQRRRPNGIMLGTLVVLLIGTVMAAGILEQGMSEFDWRGVVFGLLSAISYSLFILLSGKAVPGVHPAKRSGWMITGGMILVFVLFPPTFLFDGTLFGGLLPFGFALGLFGAFLPPVLFAIGVPHIGEGIAGILGAAELPVAVLLSSAVLHEHVSALQWTGVLVVLIGVALPELIARRKLSGVLRLRQEQAAVSDSN